MKKEIELAIIGAGIAGVAASIYAKRSGLEFSIFEAGGIGGQLLSMEDIDNYVGLKAGTKGRELAENLAKTLNDLKISVTNQEILKVELKGKEIILHTPESVYSAKGAIIATGANFAKLGFKNEAEFLGKGVSYCAVCDGFFFKGKDVAIVGGGNTAVEEALYLSEIANKVTLIHRRGELRAMEYLKKQLLDKNNIEVVFDSVVKEARGDDILREVVIESVVEQRSQTLAVAGLFVAIGIKPNTKIFKDIVSQGEKGFVITDEEMQSSVDFIWACGDCRKRPLKQLITAASEGAIAALSAYKYLKGHYISV
ncbi:MAG: FAD-dependent oxidoreductase [Candidatus Omnitrophica bacterium]|nr:FAD-dependent oxidoreductase [Candidatus Omnitrophota bacterium]